MSTFEVPVLRVDDVYNHPNADRLSIVRIRGYEAITAKLEDGSHRFQQGELVIYVPEFAVIPLNHLKERGYWNDEKNCGMLAGSKGNRVKAIKLRDVISQGLVWKTEGHGDTNWVARYENDEHKLIVEEGDDVAAYFGIQKYEEPIPASMSGQIFSLPEARFDYDIENLKNYPTLFTEEDLVVVTEKLHGTFCRISWLPDVKDDRLFKEQIAISSKGLGARGLVFKDCEENRKGNLYVRAMLNEDLEGGGTIVDMLYQYCSIVFPGRKVHLMGEVFGPGVQDLHYGTKVQFRAFDVWVEGVGFLDHDTKNEFFDDLFIDSVPVIYRGPFDRDLMDKFRGGNTTLNGWNIREGVVITLDGPQEEREASTGRKLRPILKHISDAYLMRKGGTELQ